MVSRERDLGGPSEVEVIGFEAVDLVCVSIDEPGAFHYLRGHEGRGDHRLEAVLESGGNAGVEQG